MSGMEDPLLVDTSNKEQTGWFSKTVPNTGSTARDHLANERTFLAWFRTAISMIGFGLGIAKFAGQDIFGVLFSGCFIGLGTVLLGLSWHRYNSVRMALEQGQFVISLSTQLISLLTVILVVLAYCYLIKKAQ
eukprot:gnl/MRDRNA2_/MRDRNA2_35877_c0_seq1.p1 gnl/MRDRNA2_/MRDRNA2_35877_c0~~gnl/MRDRNA2_/MRDRNA2_35877_c0_seq1.p1  ORF type:complete len:133 (-),score=20.22 gnl/MRDRNA2_/MRDRNA2_35877_c0_seq1:28-426(-)